MDAAVRCGGSKTLQAAIDWSYELLSEEERTLFQRLGVFVGGFELSAVAPVCDADEADALDLVDSLVSKSLVATMPGPGGVRYRLLETVRAYALDLLQQGGETGAMRDRHRDWYVDTFTKVGHLSETMLDNVQRVIAENQNIDAACEWSRGSGGGMTLSQG